MKKIFIAKIEWMNENRFSFLSFVRWRFSQLWLKKISHKNLGRKQKSKFPLDRNQIKTVSCWSYQNRSNKLSRSSRLGQVISSLQKMNHFSWYFRTIEIINLCIDRSLWQENISRRALIGLTVRDASELPLDDEGRDLVGLDPGLGVDDRRLSEDGEHLKRGKRTSSLS